MGKVSAGVVYLIGAGPGDPGLLTLRGAELLRAADVIIYDRLSHPTLLQMTKDSAQKIYVGKASANHAMRQSDINSLLVERAIQGLIVARLKGGDPFVFGRGGEEADYCRRSGVAFEVVPGVTSAIAAPTYAGIPVTHRDAASSFAVITGHEREDEASRSAAGSAEGRRNWKQIAWAADTLIFLMGVENLGEIASRLIENGRDPATPAGIIQWGTWPQQRVVTGDLSNIVSVVEVAGIGSPAVCIVGEVVRLRDALNWYTGEELNPLSGKRVLVTRAREQASALSDALRASGAEPVEFPTIRIERRCGNAELEQAIGCLKEYCWLVFTSVNSVDIFVNALYEAGLDSRALSSVKVAAIGPATTKSVWERLSIRTDYEPTEAAAEAALSQWPDKALTGTRILLPCASDARSLLPEGLRTMGAEVDVVAVYDKVVDNAGGAEMLQMLERNTIDALTFTSSSTVTNFIKATGLELPDLKRLLDDKVIAAIGPVTAQTLRQQGIEPQIVAEEHTISGLVSALEVYFAAAVIDSSGAVNG